MCSAHVRLVPSVPSARLLDTVTVTGKLGRFVQRSVNPQALPFEQHSRQ